MSYLIMQQLGTFPQRKTLNHKFNESNPKVRSSGALKWSIREIVKRLTAGFTAITLPSNLPSTGFNHVFSKLHNREAIAMWADKTSFMLLAPGFHRSHV